MSWLAHMPLVSGGVIFLSSLGVTAVFFRSWRCRHAVPVARVLLMLGLFVIGVGGYHLGAVMAWAWPAMTSLLSVWHGGCALLTLLSAAAFLLYCPNLVLASEIANYERIINRQEIVVQALEAQLHDRAGLTDTITEIEHTFHSRELIVQRAMDQITQTTNVASDSWVRLRPDNMVR